MLQIGEYHVDGFVSPCEKFPEGLIIEFFVSLRISLIKYFFLMFRGVTGMHIVAPTQNLL